MSTPERLPVHGDKGVYCGGDWINIEDCHEAWPTPDSKKCSGFSGDGCKGCPRRDAPADGYDVVVIGAGCVGASVTRELSKFNVKVLLV